MSQATTACKIKALEWLKELRLLQTMLGQQLRSRLNGHVSLPRILQSQAFTIS